MTEQDFYYTIEKEATAEFKDRGSKFIGYAFPVGSVENFKEKLNEVKKLHPKATHHCFAYRLGLDGNTFRVSDDGEPSGSAGRPILGQIDSKELVNVLVVVVRYLPGCKKGLRTRMGRKSAHPRAPRARVRHGTRDGAPCAWLSSSDPSGRPSG